MTMSPLLITGSVRRGRLGYTGFSDNVPHLGEPLALDRLRTRCQCEGRGRKLERDKSFADGENNR